MNAYLKHIERPPVTIETSTTTSTALFITISAICFNIHQRTMASTGLAPFIFAWYCGLTKSYKLLPSRYPSWFSLSLQLTPYSPSTDFESNHPKKISRPTAGHSFF